MKRERMIAFLDIIREEHKDDDDVLRALGEIESALNSKKYGLVWEEHKETVVLLSKREIESKKVRLEFSLEEMDLSDFQKGATHGQIKAYVLEKYHYFKVSSLYISQVKHKCGLDVGQNYNLPKSENAQQPQCPPYKEKAIMGSMIFKLCKCRKTSQPRCHYITNYVVIKTKMYVI